MNGLPFLRTIRIQLLVLLASAWLGGLAAAQTAWPYEQVRGPFRFHARFPLQPYGALLDEVARLPHELSALLGVGPVREMVDVYLFENRSVYSMYMRQYFPQVTPRRAMFIKVSGPGNVFAYLDSDFDVDLRHECTHAVLHACLPMVPLWLDEGLAEYFEVPSSARLDHHPHLNETRKHLAFHGVPSLRRLEQLRTLEEMGAAEYRDAWAWVHLLVHGPQVARAQLLALMADLRQHVPPEPISRRFETHQLDGESLFRGHFSTSKKWKIGWRLRP